MNISLKNIIPEIVEASKLAKQFHNKEFCINIKGDGTECTDIDILIHEMISSKLSQLYPNIPVISEEDVESKFEAEELETFWLLDPLDGTKSYIAGGENYSINLALISNKSPILGLLSFPHKNLMYFTDSNTVYKMDGDTESELSPCPGNVDSFNVVISQRSNLDFIKMFLKKIPINKIDRVSGAMKFVEILEGKYDIFPRHKKTFEWDVAAGDALIRAFGGIMVNQELQSINYGKKSFRNDFLLTLRNKEMLKFF